jgi:hypothetical protein
MQSWPRLNGSASTAILISDRFSIHQWPDLTLASRCLGAHMLLSDIIRTHGAQSSTQLAYARLIKYL